MKLQRIINIVINKIFKFNKNKKFIKDNILKLIELSPNILYYDLVKIFGLSLDELLKLLGIKKYIIEDEYILIYNTNDKLIYTEYSDGRWEKYKYNTNGRLIYKVGSYGEWEKSEYDDNGNCIYIEDSYGFWIKWEYDNNGNKIYEEHSDGRWEKRVYDDNGDFIYIENSDGNKYTY